MKRGTLIILAVLLAAVFSGCVVLAAGAAGAGGVFYVRGEAKKSYPHGVVKVYNATVSALEDSNVMIALKSADEVSGRIEGKFADGKEIKIKFDAAGSGITDVKMRIGTWGDKSRSEFLFSKIDARL